jgi:heat shock protein HslJ
MLTRKGMLIPLFMMVMLLAVAGCGPINIVPDTGPEETPSLAGTAWVLTRINNRGPVEGAEVTLSFDETTAGGNSGCNSYGGDYTAGTDGSLTIGEIVQTLMLCTEPEGVMELEEEYINTLRLASLYRVANDRLEIMDQAGSIILEYERQ